MNTKVLIRGFFCGLSLCAFTILAGAACSSRSVLPDVNELKVGREQPKGDCSELGRVTGQSMSAKKGSSQEALDNMKKEASAKGATYLRVDQYSETGMSASGTAFVCR